MSVLCNIIGFIILLHAVFSANQYKAWSIILGLRQQYPPLDVIIECVLAFGIIMWGQLPTLNLKSTVLSSTDNWTSMDNFLSRPDSIILRRRKKKIT